MIPYSRIMTTIISEENAVSIPAIEPIFHEIADMYRPAKPIEDPISTPILTCKVAISPGVYLYGVAVGSHFWCDVDPVNTYYINRVNNESRQVLEVDPFFTAEAVGQAFNTTVTVTERSYDYYSSSRTVQKLDSYGETYDYNTRQSKPGLPYNYLKMKLTFMDKSIEKTFKFKQPESGEIDLDVSGDKKVFVINTEFFGLKSVSNWNIGRYRSGGIWSAAWHKLTTCNFKQGVQAFLIRFFEACTVNDSRALKGIEKRKEVRLVLDRLLKDEPLLWAFYSFLKSGKTVKKMSNNRLLAAVLLDCGKNYKKFKQQLEIVLRDTLGTAPGHSYDIIDATRVMCMRFPTAIKADAKVRAKAEWNMRETLSAQAQGLGIHPRRHKNLMRAVRKGQIALSIFHTTGDPLNLINVEFDLWERALRRKGWSDVIVNICNSVTNKNRFEKHVTPYLSFLFRIEKYLKRHTGRNWTAFPKLVNSEAQLEMQERDENGTVKTRSALTPIADNEKNTITVPYAGLKMYGAQTTYCYSKHYVVFENNSIDEVSGSVIVNDLEKKLNGRDDYGLMYYTLDGSVEAQGYPTFLVIFERRKVNPSGLLKKYTHVHFHRVHPSRKKDGKMVPACRLVEECYRYMCGNILPSEIIHQQGDLIFLKAENQDLKPEDGKGVLDFESHQFYSPDNPVKFWENKATSIKNRLGFIKTDVGFTLRHPEHEWITFAPGIYEIRRCKSYENNPSSSWSYVCD